MEPNSAIVCSTRRIMSASEATSTPTARPPPPSRLAGPVRLGRPRPPRACSIGRESAGPRVPLAPPVYDHLVARISSFAQMWIRSGRPSQLQLGDRLAMHLVGPVSQPQRARAAHAEARPKSSLTPAPPWAWMARSITRSAMFGATTLIIAISAARRLVADGIHHVGRLQGEQPGLLDLDARHRRYPRGSCPARRAACRTPRALHGGTSLRVRARPGPISRMQW